VRVHYGLCDSQSQAAATRFGPVRHRRAVKALEDMWQVLWSNSDTLILEADGHRMVGSVQGHLDSGVWGRVLHGVLEKDEKEIAQERFVSDGNNILANIE